MMSYKTMVEYLEALKDQLEINFEAKIHERPVNTSKDMLHHIKAIDSTIDLLKKKTKLLRL